jgi:ABC-type oligopeptide transport system substrate-binding subunit
VGEYVQDQLRELGIDVVLNPLNEFELQQKIISGESDFYYLGWRSELGDSLDFLGAVAYTRNIEEETGLFNGMNYSNEEVDILIEDAKQNHDTSSRVRQMQKAMKIIVEDDIIGIPLFESETLYAFNKDVKFQPRVDGQVFVYSIK